MKNSFFSLVALLLLMLFNSCSEKRMITKFYPEAPQPMRNAAAFKALNPMQQDIEILIALIKDAYPMWEQKITPTELESERQKLIQLFAHEKDAKVMEIEVQRLLARLKDWHTKVPYLDLDTKRYFPFKILISHDSCFIVNVGQMPKKDSATILGSLIEGINGFSRTEINAKIWAFESTENYFDALDNGELSYPNYLKAIGLATQTDSLNLLLRTRNGELRKITLKAVEEKDLAFYTIKYPTFPYECRGGSYNYKIDKSNDLAYFNVGTMLDFVALSDGMKQYIPNPILYPIAKNIAKKRAEKSGTLNFKKTALEVIEAANREGVNNLVIDLRRNGGGDMRIAEQLFYLLDFEVKKPYQQYKKLTNFYKKYISNDAKEDADRYKKATGEALVFDGRLLNIDSIVASKEGYAFYKNVKNPQSAFYISPNAPRFHGKIYFLIGLGTGSAAAMTATLVKDNDLATVIGTPTGNKPTTQTGASGFKLPNSKVVCNISYFYVERPNTAKNEETGLQPDVEVWQNPDDLYKGVDSKMAWISNDIKARQTSKK